MMTISHMAARMAPPWNAPPGSLAPDPDDMDADHDADRRQQLGEEGQRASGIVARRGPAMPPQLPSAASDHTPMTASNSTTFSSRVSSARKAIRTAVTGLPSSVAARAGPPRGRASRRGQASSARRGERRRDDDAKSAASRRDPAPGHSAATAASVPRRRAAALISSTPVTPLPIAASVSATSTRTGEPRPAPPAALGDVADDRGESFARRDGPDGDAEHEGREADIEGQITLMVPALRRAARAMSCATVALGEQHEQPDRDELQAAEQTVGLRQQARARSGRGRDCRPWSAHAGGSAYRESAAGHRPARKKNAPARPRRR